MEKRGTWRTKRWTLPMRNAKSNCNLPKPMNTSSLFLVLGFGLTFGAAQMASAYDDDPGYGPYRPRYDSEDKTWRPWNGDSYGRDRERYGDERERYARPMYYRPTMRYYGRGYTVSYRYMPIYWSEVAYGAGSSFAQSSNFRTEAFHIKTEDVPAWGAKLPRLTLPERRAPHQTAITSIQRTQPISTLSLPTLPPVDPSANFNVDPTIPAITTPAPDTAPAPAPKPTEAPKK
jgi:hypothetical protein